jgi:hypothetical protein
VGCNLRGDPFGTGDWRDMPHADEIGRQQDGSIRRASPARFELEGDQEVKGAGAQFGRRSQACCIGGADWCRASFPVGGEAD